MTSERQSVRMSIRWFLAELLVVVVGILIAIGLQSWWQRRSDVAREHAYLDQLLADTRQNDSTIARRVLNDSTMRERHVRLLRILRDGVPATPADTLVSLSRMAATSLELASATHDALVATGDVSLLRDPVVRASTLCVGTGISHAESVVNSNVDLQRTLLGQRTAMFLRYLRPPEASTPAASDSLDTAWWSRIDYERLKRDPEALNVYQTSVYMYSNSLSAERRIRTVLSSYRQMLEQHLAGEPPGEVLCYK